MESNALVMWKNSILIYKGVVEIHHIGLIWRQDYYDKLELWVMTYLHNEGFLEDKKGLPIHIADIQIFDGMGKRVTREQLI